MAHNEMPVHQKLVNGHFCSVARVVNPLDRLRRGVLGSSRAAGETVSNSAGHHTPSSRSSLGISQQPAVLG
ncbi:hypothetical protein ASH04_05720 [Rhodococcus sp. Leaf233]|nr:hypothetical protein ASH04_05720 [Rhodococcus sp. Leaf233]